MSHSASLSVFRRRAASWWLFSTACPRVLCISERLFFSTFFFFQNWGWDILDYTSPVRPNCVSSVFPCFHERNLVLLDLLLGTWRGRSSSCQHTQASLIIDHSKKKKKKKKSNLISILLVLVPPNTPNSKIKVRKSSLIFVGSTTQIQNKEVLYIPWIPSSSASMNSKKQLRVWL